MDARPSARADLRLLLLATAAPCLNGCPAERAGGQERVFKSAEFTYDAESATMRMTWERYYS